MQGKRRFDKGQCSPYNPLLFRFYQIMHADVSGHLVRIVL